MTTSDNRAYQRIQFFRLAKEQEFVPVWVFNSINPGNTVVGLVVNMSDSGIQILTAADEQPEKGGYELTFLDQAQADNLPPCRIHYIWSEQEDSLYIRSGFSFDDVDEQRMRALVEHIHHADHGFLRCTLEPLHDSATVIAVAN